MLKSLYVDNYKSLVNFKIEFTDKNVLLGKNGSGKSTIFQVLHLLQLFLNGQERIETLIPAETLTKWQAVNIQSFEIKLSTEKGLFTYSLTVEQAEHLNSCRVKTEKVTYLETSKILFKSELGKAVLYNDSFEQGPEILTDWSLSGVSMVQERKDNKLLTFFINEMKKIIVCTPLPFEMKNIAEDEQSMLNTYCTNIAETYRYMLLSHTNLVSDLLQELKKIIPSIETISFKEGAEIKRLRFTMRYKNKKFDYLLSALSEGEKMLFLLYLIVKCYMPLGFSIFIDEPDNWLSLQEIQPWLSSVEDILEQTKGQCVIISHCSEVVDYWAGSNGLWFSRLDYGATRLIEAPQIDKPVSYSQGIIQGLIDDFK